jgi:hypothetical protein
MPSNSQSRPKPTRSGTSARLCAAAPGAGTDGGQLDEASRAHVSRIGSEPMCLRGSSATAAEQCVLGAGRRKLARISPGEPDRRSLPGGAGCRRLPSRRSAAPDIAPGVSRCADGRDRSRLLSRDQAGGAGLAGLMLMATAAGPVCRQLPASRPAEAHALHPRLTAGLETVASARSQGDQQDDCGARVRCAAGGLDGQAEPVRPDAITGPVMPCWGAD